MINIGNVKLKHGVMLAPMAGVTDYAFRYLCKLHGAEYMVSEMISAKGMHYNDNKTMDLAKITDFERPMALQIFGNDPDIMAESAVRLQNSVFKPDVIDINMGCPMKKIVNNGEGAALMLNPDLAGKCIKKIADSLDIPLSVKIRSGWDNCNINAVKIAEIAEINGAAMICVHGRTRNQMYMPPVDLDIIKKVRQSVSIPVIGNGGINNASDALHMLDYTGCCGIMIARGAMGNPWIFDEITAVLNGLNYNPPDTEERLNTAVYHAELLVADKGARIGVNEARKHMAWYIKGIQGASDARKKINTAGSLDEIRDVINSLVVR